MHFRTFGPALFLAATLVLASCGSSSTEVADDPDPSDDSSVSIVNAEVRTDDDFVVHWSLVDPLTREDVGLGSLEETDQDIFVRSWRQEQLLDVRLELPAGATFAQQAQEVTGTISRLDGLRSDVVVVTDGFTLAEAEAMLADHAAQFGLDMAKVSAWKAESESFFDEGDFGRQRVNLTADPLGYLVVSVEAVANAATDDAAIYWRFAWD